MVLLLRVCVFWSYICPAVDSAMACSWSADDMTIISISMSWNYKKEKEVDRGRRIERERMQSEIKRLRILQLNSGCEKLRSGHEDFKCKWKEPNDGRRAQISSSVSHILFNWCCHRKSERAHGGGYTHGSLADSHSAWSAQRKTNGKECEVNCDKVSTSAQLLSW